MVLPGDDHGLQFVYPHERATQLAKRTNQNVLSMRNEMTQNMAAPAKSAGESSVQELEKTDVSGVNSTGDPVALEIVILKKP